MCLRGFVGWRSTYVRGKERPSMPYQMHQHVVGTGIARVSLRTFGSRGGRVVRSHVLTPIGPQPLRIRQREPRALATIIRRDKDTERAIRSRRDRRRGVHETARPTAELTLKGFEKGLKTNVP